MLKSCAVLLLVWLAGLPSIPAAKRAELKKLGYSGIFGLELLGSSSFDGDVKLRHHTTVGIDDPVQTMSSTVSIGPKKAVALFEGTVKTNGKPVNVDHIYEIGFDRANLKMTFNRIGAYLNVASRSPKTIFLCLTFDEPHGTGFQDSRPYWLIASGKEGLAANQYPKIYRLADHSLWIRLTGLEAQVFSSKTAPLENLEVKPNLTVKLAPNGFMLITKVDPQKTKK